MERVEDIRANIKETECQHKSYVDAEIVVCKLCPAGAGSRAPGRSAGPASWPSARGAGAYGAAWRVTVKVLPTSGVLSTRAVPP